MEAKSRPSVVRMDAPKPDDIPQSCSIRRRECKYSPPELCASLEWKESFLRSFEEKRTTVSSKRRQAELLREERSISHTQPRLVRSDMEQALSTSSSTTALRQKLHLLDQVACRQLVLVLSQVLKRRQRELTSDRDVLTRDHVLFAYSVFLHLQLPLPPDSQAGLRDLYHLIADVRSELVRNMQKPFL